MGFWAVLADLDISRPERSGVQGGGLERQPFGNWKIAWACDWHARSGVRALSLPGRLEHE